MARIRPPDIFFGDPSETWVPSPPRPSAAEGKNKKTPDSNLMIWGLRHRAGTSAGGRGKEGW